MCLAMCFGRSSERSDKRRPSVIETQIPLSPYPPPSPPQAYPTLHSLLSDDVARTYFKCFLNESLSVENIIFYEEVTRFRSTDVVLTEEGKKEEAMRIYRKFIKPASSSSHAYVINITYQIKEDISKAVTREQVDWRVFQAALKQVVSYMEQDLWLIFRNSSYCEQLNKSASSGEALQPLPEPVIDENRLGESLMFSGSNDGVGNWGESSVGWGYVNAAGVDDVYIHAKGIYMNMQGEQLGSTAVEKIERRMTSGGGSGVVVIEKSEGFEIDGKSNENSTSADKDDVKKKKKKKNSSAILPRSDIISNNNNTTITNANTNNTPVEKEKKKTGSAILSSDVPNSNTEEKKKKKNNSAILASSVPSSPVHSDSFILL